MVEQGKKIELPSPAVMSEQPIETLLQQRRSIRSFRMAPLSLAEIGQLLWAAQGITSPQGLRTAPSAGALYPLELYVVTGNVEGLPPAVYHYRPKAHHLIKILEGDQRRVLARTALGQSWISDAAAVVVIAAKYKRTTRKYGERGIRYVHMEVGHAGQNLFLQAEAMGLATVVVGAFHDDKVDKLLSLPDDIQVLSLMPVGKR